MGGQASKSSKKKYKNPYANANRNFQIQYDDYSTQSNVYSERQAQQQIKTAAQASSEKRPQFQPQPEVEEELASPRLSSGGGGYESSEDEFYDGIPRFRRTLSQKSRSRRTRVSVMAAEVFDTLGNSMANLNPGNGFISGTTAKNNELSILSFEVANTIVKGSSILQSLSRRSIRLLTEGVLPSEGVQKLVSTNMDELLKIVAADTRQELKIFAGEVVRFGNRCKDPQWHNLDLFFKKHGREPQKQMWEEAEVIMQQLMTLAQHTAELYQNLHGLDRFEQEYQYKRVEASISSSLSRGNGPAALAAELKTRRKLVKGLKKKSLWSRSLEEVMGKLVDIVLFLNQEINNVFKITVDDDASEVKSLGDQQRLGPSGLALHYANIILLIDSIVARSTTLQQNARENLYQSLPPCIKSPLRSKWDSFRVKEQLTITEIKAEMEKTLQWLVPVATNTAKAHYGFGWVGEWANTGSGPNRQSAGTNDVIPIETLHHANKQKTEAYILELLLWLNYLVSQSKAGTNDGKARSLTKAPFIPPLKETDQEFAGKSGISSSESLSIKDQKAQQDAGNKRHIQGTNTGNDYVKHDEESSRIEATVAATLQQQEAVNQHP